MGDRRGPSLAGGATIWQPSRVNRRQRLVGRVERLVLGALMSVAATLVERQLKRAFDRRRSVPGAEDVGEQAAHRDHAQAAQGGGHPDSHPR